MAGVFPAYIRDEGGCEAHNFIGEGGYSILAVPSVVRVSREVVKEVDTCFLVYA